MAKDTSIETGRIREFSTADYVVFGLSLGLFAIVGIYHAVKDRIRKRENTEEFLLGGRSMAVFPVSLSLTVTFLSALTLLGNPAEMYTSNTMFSWSIVGGSISMLSVGVIFIPFFYRLGVTSTFQYLEWRFDSSVRLMGSVVLALQTLTYMAFVLYAPSLAFSAATGLNLWMCVIGIGAIATFYTGMGGMKAVLWTDALQFFFMVAGILAVLIQGSIETGGFAAAWDLADSRGRIVLDDFSFNPATRHSVWSVVVGGIFFWTSLYGINQAQVQRCLSVPTVRKAQLAILFNTPGLVLIMLLTFLSGIVMFAFYADCDPVKSGIIDKSDQLLIVFVMDILGHLPGIPGIFISCVFSGSLSSISSSLNAISTVTYEDFIKRFCCPKLGEFSGTILNKVIVFAYGALAICMAYVVSQAGNILQASLTIYGVINGPLFGVFVLAMFFPWANKWGALSGCLCSLAFMGWIGFGYFVNKIKTSLKSPVSIAGCTHLNMTDSIGESNATSPVLPTYEGVERLYTLSYMYYTATGVCAAVVVGLSVSFITGPTKPSSLDPRLICPFFDLVFPYLPECILKPLRFGVDHTNKYEKSDPKTIGGGTDHVEVEVANPKQRDKEQGVTNPGFNVDDTYDTRL